MDESQLKKAFKAHAQLNLIALIAWGVGAALVISGFLIPYSNGIFSSSVIAPAYLVALAPTLYFWNQSRAIVKATEKLVQLEKYDKVRGMQAPATVLVTIGAVAMIPGVIILLQMVPVGWAILFNLYAGAIIGLRLNSVHRRVQYFRGQGLEPNAIETNIYKTPREALPPSVKRPIGQAFVLVGGIVILGINLMMEFSTFTAIRDYGMLNGVIKDVGAQMLFSLGQVFDVLVLSTIGVLLLVLALFNQARVANKRQNLIAIGIVVAGLVIFPGGLSTILAGAAGPSDSLVQTQNEGRESTEVVRAIMGAGAVPGFEGVYEEFADCELEGCSDSVMRLAKEVGPESQAAEYCAGIVEFGVAVGMTSWSVAPGYSPEELTEELGPATQACRQQLDNIKIAEAQQYQAYSEAFVMEGTSAVGPAVPIRFVLTQAIDGDLDDNPGFHTYFLEITTTFQTGPMMNPEDGLSAGTVEVNDLLDLIGQQRLANPEREPMDRAFTEEILASYPHEIEMRLIENEAGEIYRLEVTTSDGDSMCLSIEPWDSDPANQDFPDPGMGYGLGFMESLDVLRGFGNAVSGSCG